MLYFSKDSFVAPSTDEIMELLVAWSSLRHDAFCLSVLFTYQDFSNGVLGLAWVGDLNNGGICSKRVIPQNSTEEINFNTAVVTLLNGKSTVPRKASIVTITHELGHSFGASVSTRLHCIQLFGSSVSTRLHCILFGGSTNTIIPPQMDGNYPNN